MRRSAFFAFAFLIAGVVPVRAAKQLNKAVHVSVAAPWSSTPLALEASEFFASDTNAASSHGDQFWKYVEALPAGVISQHDKAQYDAAIAAATPLLSTSQLDLLEYALAIRQFSPTLQAHRELWQTAESLGCSIKDGAAVAILNDRDCITDPAALKEAIKAARQGGPGGTVLDMDHEYTGSNATSGVVVHLFATVGSETFRAFHKKLSKSATKGKIRYVLRHAWPEKEDASAHPMMVQGYGVEMAIKNMEYKAVDDQKKEGGASAEDGGEEEDEVAGFDFKVLLQRKPEREVELLSLRDALLSEARQAESTDIKVWALKDLGVQASQRILQADDPLRLIRDLSHNLPALVGSLSRMRVNATIRAELESNRNYMHPGTNMLFVNGRTLHLDALTPYKLFEFVRHEVRMMESMQDLGLDVRSGRKVLNAPSAGGGMGGMMGGGESGFKLDVLSDDNVHWVNDIEKDDMYSSWPRSLDALLQRGWPGQMRHVRRNLFTLIYMIDPDSMEDLAHVSDAWAMVQHQMPVRFGFIFKSAAAALNPASVAPADAGAGAAAEGAKEEEEGSGRASPAAAAAVSDGVGLYRLFRSLYERHGKQAAFAFVDSYYHRAAVAVGGADGRRDIRKQVFKETVKKFRAPSKKARAKYDRDLKSAAADEGLRKSSAFARSTGVGLRGATCVVNGVVLEGPNLDQNSVHYMLQMQMQELQRLAYFGQLDEHRDMYPQIINHGGPAYKRFHKLIVPGREASTAILKVDDAAPSYRQLVQRLARVPAAACGKEAGKPRALTHLLAVDMAAPEGCAVVQEAWKRLVAGEGAGEKEDGTCARTQVVMLDNSKDDTGREAVAAVQELMRAPSSKAQEVLDVAASICSAIAGGEWDKAKAAEPLQALLAKAAARAGGGAGPMGAEEQRALVKALFGVEEGKSAVATSGRVFGVSGDVEFVHEDFVLAESTEWEARSQHVAAALDAAEWPGVPAEEVTVEYMSMVGLVGAAVIAREKQDHIVRRDQEANRQWQSKVSGFHVGPPVNQALLHTVAFIDPLCKDAQRMAPMLMALADGFKAHLHVILNPVAEVGSLPIKGYYRYVLQPRLTFAPDGSMAGTLRATFSNLPVSKLLSMNLHPPDAWFVSAAECIHDMDNVLLDKLEPHQTALLATYRLDHILVTGHCIDASSHEPPAGLQLNLHAAGGRGKGLESIGDTLVMSNLGYFQLKARPGTFELSLAAGRSSDMYSLPRKEDGAGVGGAAAGSSEAAEVVGGGGRSEAGVQSVAQTYALSVASWEPEAISLTVQRRGGTYGMRLLDSMEDQGGGDSEVGGGGGDGGQSMWSAMGQMMFGMGEGDKGGKGGNKVDLAALPSGKDHETIHVFSLASGHLYERFLKIMMLSVVSNTKAPVKFWLLNNFLSPQFKQFIPRMASHFNFEYELVTYKWPSWLHAQTEKQRIIWGYKILMLDVLFPLSVKKIIYIDSDQTVRGDLRELYNMDLRGRPYAYTPFCDSNTEMEGYRFWKQGFWASHLGKTPYHISALYVVDLQRFRQIGAGDQLRVIYSQLSRDPNSLANLDQDLPNYAQMQVPIFSLPQEWLWCETWCSQSSKKEAKTIDLCNNPMTKEPKLEQAKRIVDEWQDYDARIRSVEEKCSSEA